MSKIIQFYKITDLVEIYISKIFFKNFIQKFQPVQNDLFAFFILNFLLKKIKFANQFILQNPEYLSK